MSRIKTIQPSGRPLASLATALVSVLLVVACSSASSTPSPTSQPTPQVPSASATAPSSSNNQYLTVDSTTRTANLILNITGFTFDGYSNGQMSVNVPQGWKVNVQCNNQTTSPHSCAVVADSTSTTPVFSGGSTTNPTTGLQPGASQSFTFMAGTAGQYRIACLVPGHEDAGMWDNFVVTSSGSPSLTT
jgi:uncharacterized cupredoxin-like copper-binding protein